MASPLGLRGWRLSLLVASVGLELPRLAIVLPEQQQQIPQRLPMGRIFDPA